MSHWVHGLTGFQLWVIWNIVLIVAKADKAEKKMVSYYWGVAGSFVVWVYWVWVAAWPAIFG